jgi:hypothetical protein
MDELEEGKNRTGGLECNMVLSSLLLAEKD